MDNIQSPLLMSPCCCYFYYTLLLLSCSYLQFFAFDVRILCTKLFIFVSFRYRKYIEKIKIEKSSTGGPKGPQALCRSYNEGSIATQNSSQ